MTDEQRDGIVGDARHAVALLSQAIEHLARGTLDGDVLRNLDHAAECADRAWQNARFGLRANVGEVCACGADLHAFCLDCDGVAPQAKSGQEVGS